MTDTRKAAGVVYLAAKGQTHYETTAELADKLSAVIDEFRDRGVTIATILGTLECVKFDVLNDAIHDGNRP